MNRQVLALDVSGTPRRWVSAEDAVAYYARSLVAWEYGETAMLFRGGWQRGGERSAVRVSSIIAVRGREFRVVGGEREPLLTNEKLFERDRCVCAYCGGRFRAHQLSREHVVPVSRGGTDSWKNLVSACRGCNVRKGNRTPEEARMPLLYLPYLPSRWEDFILANRRILADQMAYLLAKVPAGSRLRS